MTNIQSIMLAFCFGSAVGVFVGNIIFLVMTAIERRKDKKRIRRKLEEKQ